jgi:Tol biopolymer transport system component
MTTPSIIAGPVALAFLLGCSAEPDRRIAGTLFADHTSNFSAWSEPVSLGPIVNSSADDQGAFISKDGLVLDFVSTRSGGFGGQDLYVSHRVTVDDPWGAPHNVGPSINTGSNEASPTLSADGHRLYFHSDRAGGFGGRDLYVSRRHDKQDDFGWEPPENLGPEINTPGNERGLTLFEDDESEIVTAFFDSDRPGGTGGIDIYASTVDADGAFGPAVLVPELSSPFNELLPGIRRDGLEIFLDSGRPGTLGPRDIWVSTRASTSDSWSPPVNLAAVNSTAGDQRAALSFDGTALYVASNRLGSFGDNDLYVSTRTRLTAP